MVDCPSRDYRIWNVIVKTFYSTIFGFVFISLGIGIIVEDILSYKLSDRLYLILGGLIGFSTIIFWAWNEYQDHRDCIRAKLFKEVLYFTETVTMLRQIASDINR